MNVSKLHRDTGGNEGYNLACGCYERVSEEAILFVDVQTDAGKKVVLKPSNMTKAPYTQVAEDGGPQQPQPDGPHAVWYDGMI